MTRSSVLLPLALLLLPACSSDADAPSSPRPAAVATATATAAPAPSSTSAASAAPAASPSPSLAGTSAGPSPSASAPAAAASAGAASAAPAAPGAPAARGAAPASLATREGRYTYDSRGTFTTTGAPARTASGSATLTVDRPAGGMQTAVLEGDQGRTETEAVLRGDGRYLSRLLLTTPAFSKEFRAAPPVLLLPEDATPGKRWSFTLTSTDGRTTATARNRIVRSEKVTVGGTSVDTRVVETVLALRGDVVYDGTTTTNYAPSRRLAVRERGSGRGTVSGVTFTADTRSTLRSLDPA